MLKEGSVLPDNTASAHKANEPFSMECEVNERGEGDYSCTQALPIVIEGGNCATGYGDEMREQREKQIFHEIISDIVTAAPIAYTCKRPLVNCTVLHIHTQQAYIHTVCLPPSLPPNTHTYNTYSTRKGSSVKAKGGLLVCNMTCRQL